MIARCVFEVACALVERQGTRSFPLLFLLCEQKQRCGCARSLPRSPCARVEEVRRVHRTERDVRTCAKGAQIYALTQKSLVFHAHKKGISC